MTTSNKVLIGIVGVIVLAGFALGVFGFLKGVQNTPDDISFSREVVFAFQRELVSRALARGPHPIEGFDALLLVGRFPGLTEEDFDGVASFEGHYTYENGELTYQRTADTPVTSAEQTVSEEGYTMLLRNLSVRLNMPVTSTGDAVAIIDMLDSSDAGDTPSAVGTPVTVSGELTCLPKRGSGAQTRECAIGLAADDGSFYALENLSEYDFALQRTGTAVVVNGMLREEERFGPDGNPYDIIGVIVISSLVVR